MMPRRLQITRAVALFVVAASLVLAAASVRAALQFPALTGRVVDEAGLLTPPEKQRLTETLKAAEEATGNQIVVVTLKSLQGTDIQDFGYQLGRAWGIGRKDKDDGVLLIVAPAERKVRIEVGYGLEGELTDAASRLIIERIMLPAFRSGQYGEGILAGAGAIVEVLSGEGDPAAQKAARPREDRAIGLVPMLMLGGFVLLMWASSRRRGSGGGFQRGRRGGVPPIVFPGGFGGGGGGGGGFGGGGFGGGGGSFGGGGASGDW